MVLLIDNYDSFSYILFQYLSEIKETILIKNDDPLPDSYISRITSVVLSPGPGLPNTSGRLIQYTKYFLGKLPVLGVCLGHQTIAQISGAQLIQTRDIYHGRTSKVHHQEVAIFKNIPSPFVANRYHSWAVSSTNLPKELEVIAETEDGVIMGIRHLKFKHTYGVQFHPESILTEHGKTLLSNFCKEF